MTRQPSQAASPSPTEGTILEPKVESIGVEDAAPADLGVETTAVKTMEVNDISDNKQEVETVTGISGNPGASSSGEPSTVGTSVVAPSAVQTAVQMSPAATAKSTRTAAGCYVSTGDGMATHGVWPPGWVRLSQCAEPVVLDEGNGASSGEDDDAENPWIGLS